MKQQRCNLMPNYFDHLLLVAVIAVVLYCLFLRQINTVGQSFSLHCYFEYTLVLDRTDMTR